MMNKSLFPIFLFTLLFSCSDSLSDDAPIYDQQTLEFHNFTKQFFGNQISKAEVREVSDIIPEYTDLIEQTVNSNHILGEFYIKAHSNEREGLVEFSSVTYHIDNSDNRFESIVSFTNETGFVEHFKMVLKQIENDKFEINEVSILERNSVELRGWFSDYGKCIGRVLDTDEFVGQTITVLGIAGGAGCVGCGIAGAVIFGFGALGCAAG